MVNPAKINFPYARELALKFGDKERSVLLVGAAAMCWAIWRCRNDIILTKPSILHLYRLFSEGPTGCANGCTYSMKI